MRVVLDANILVSFLLTSGPTISQIMTFWRQNKFTLLTTDEILTEIKQVLARFVAAKLIKEEAALALLTRLEKDGQLVQSLAQVTASPDKKDNRYLAAAKDGQADYLVTGDKKHLLALKQFGGIKIISPKEFLIDIVSHS